MIAGMARTAPPPPGPRRRTRRAEAPARTLRRALTALVDGALKDHDLTLPGRTRGALITDARRLMAGPGRVGAAGRVVSRGDLHRHVITLRCPDQAFFLDAVKVYLHRRGIDPILQLTLVARAEHGTGGAVTDLGPPETGTPGNEMIVALHVSATLVPDGRGLKADLGAILSAVAASVRDFEAVAERVETAARHLARDDPEAAGLLSWMGRDRYLMFGLLHDGHRLGITANRRNFERVAEGLQAEIEALPPPTGPGLAWLFLTTAPGFLYGAAPLEVVRIAWRTRKGGRLRTAVLLGYFARSARHMNAHQVPCLAGVWGRVRTTPALARSDYLEREVRTVFDRIPKPVLLATPVPELARGLFAMVERSGPGRTLVLDWHPDPGRVRLIVAALPLNRFSTQVQEGVLEAVTAAGLTPLTHNNVAVGPNLHMFISCAGDAGSDVDLHNLAQAVQECAITWRDRALVAVRVGLPVAEVREAIADLTALPRLYTDLFPPETFVSDLKVVRRVRADGRPHVRLEAREDGVSMYIFTALPVALGRLVEVVQAFGLAALDEVVVDLPGDPPVHLTCLRASYPVALHAETLPRLKAALEAVLGDLADNDAANALVLSAGLDADAVAVLITLRNHLVQLVPDASPGVLTRTLLFHPDAAAAAYRLFDVRHHPEREDEEAGVRRAFDALLNDTVQNLTDDRWFRAFAELIGASVRTNAFVRPPGEPVAIKVRPADLSFCPEPVPYREIFVHGRHVEGVHLRGGPVARGGLRLSDRPTDFRTEVLELMATQVPKNGVIVPTGAKGGFVLRGGTGAAFAEAGYRSFVRALLSVTDNRVAGRAVAPQGVRVAAGDADDPYLVVAADKGTATFSDLANAEAEAAGFWLGDAFASGGSNGYDHKEFGITARGAWVCVRHHFHRLGVDPEREPVTVVGIGDMGGDVFGNGLLQSRTLRLIGAFNHRHVFLDPDPDPKVAFAERRRLFARGGGWDRYDPKKISQGGGVFDRTAKRIPVGPEAAAALGIEPGDRSGEALIRVLLCAPVDLLYNGGIGTYVRAASEPDEEARDPANKSVRVTAEALRCRVVGEGGNLGFTQWGRIAFARRGGHMDTDAIDNCGGVNMSDHEVNLKVLLAHAPHPPTGGRRNRLLKELGETVAGLCLADSLDQAHALSVAEHQAEVAPPKARRLRDRLVADGRIDPDAPGMGADQGDTLALRPQLAVLMGHEKNRIKARLADDGFAARSCFAADLLEAYFPPRVVERYRPAVHAHPLGEGIVHTMAAGRAVSRFGLFAVSHLEDLTGAGVGDVVQALLTADDLLDAAPLRRALWTRAGGMDATVRVQAALQAALTDFAEELLRLCPVGELSRDWMRDQRPHFTRFRHVLERDGAAAGGRFERRVAEAREAGLSGPHAVWAAALPQLARCGVALHASARLGVPLPRCLAANRAVFALLPFLTAETQLRSPTWGGAELTHQVRVEWLHRLVVMRDLALERLLAARARDPLEAGRRLWQAHPHWEAVENLARAVEASPDGDPMQTVLLLTRLESLIDDIAG
jgi:glutamate dehydrogenase